jgi:hypothetical protein
MAKADVCCPGALVTEAWTPYPALANASVGVKMFQIERIRDKLAKPKIMGGREYDVFELGGNGFLVTGYASSGYWLVSPLGRRTHGHICVGRPTIGWAVGQDRRDYHRKHVYVLDLPSRSCREVEGLDCRWELDVIELDANTLVAICRPPGSEMSDDRRDIVVIDLASASITDRFRLEGVTTIFGPSACSTLGARDGTIVMAAYQTRSETAGPRVFGIAKVWPARRQIEFTPFPADQGAPTRHVSPSGAHILLGRYETRPPTLDASGAQLKRFAKGAAYLPALELWRSDTLMHVRDLPVGLSYDSNSDRQSYWPDEAALTALIRWQPDEAAFWWILDGMAVCVGLDGCSSPRFRLTHNNAHACQALPGRIAEFREDKGKFCEVQRLDGAPAEDRSARDAPPPEAVAFTADQIKRQAAAQKEVTALTKAKNELKFAAKSAEVGEIVAVIEKILVALERGLGWYADDQGRVTLSVKIGDTGYSDNRFFALVETLGAALAPALTRLVRRCARDPDLSDVWFGDPEHGQQAFGAAARALGGVDAGAWLEVARYGQGIDAYHELYFREQVVPHFLKVHGWREESFLLAIADIAQVRGNLGDNFVWAWRGSGLAKAAEAAYTPEAFAVLMLRVRDSLLSAPAGGFAQFAADPGDPPARHGWRNYDRMYDQLQATLTPWETSLFAALRSA